MPDKVRTQRERRLADLAKTQRGVVSARQLRDLGYSTSTISDAAGRGRLHPIHRGVCAVGHRSLTWEGYCMAAVLARPGSVASHKSAAWIWELRRWRPETIHVTAATRQRVKRDFVVHFARLEPEDTAAVEEIPVTSMARTVLDLAPEESTRDLHRMMNRAEERKAFDLRRFEGLLARAGGHPGRVKLRHALDTFKPEQAVLRSDLERRFRDLVLAAGLSAPRSVSVRASSPKPWDRRRRIEVLARHATRVNMGDLERRRRAGGPRRSVA